MAETDELDDRVPCSDDMCVGIIGPSGKCGVCGLPGTLPVGGARARTQESAPGTEGREPAAEDRWAAAQDRGTGDAVDPDERVPCLDDMCVGILGPTGRCGTCGKTWPRP